MNRHVAMSLFCASAAVALVHAQNAPQGQPTFTTSTDVVMVDVSVRKGGKQVSGLTAADFELRDNGVKQDVETVESQAVPIDLSILIDVSGNADRPWLNLPFDSEVAGKVTERARQLTKLLRPGDRVRLFALSTYIQQLWPLQAANQVPDVQHINFDGMPSLYDSLLTLLLQPVEPRRRHVIVAETKGLDAGSVTSANDVRDVAAHSDAQVHFVMMERKADEEVTVRPWQCRYMDLCSATYRFWVPPRRRLFPAVPIVKGAAPLRPLSLDGRALKDGADATGGGLYQGEGLSEPTLVNTFETAFQNFRQSYILRYSAKGVSRPGWHEITVTVPRDKSVQIKARNGYSIDAPVAEPVRPPAPSVALGNTPLRTAAEINRAYETDAFDLVTRSLRQLPDPGRFITEFEAAGNVWPATPHREAALAIQVAEAGVFAVQPPARDQGATLLKRFSTLIRMPFAPDDFEREWLVAASRMLQGTMKPALSEPFIDGALERFPTDSRLVMAKAIAIDQRWPMSGPVVDRMMQVTRSTASAAHMTAVTAAFEAAAAFPDTRAEATVRYGWFLHRIGRDAEALAKIETADVDPADRALAYLKELLAGQVLQALDRNADAMTRFRRATALAPGAQSARVALMNALLLEGNRAEASTLASEVQSTPATVIDPWWMYWQGDYRRYPESLDRLRSLIR